MGTLAVRPVLPGLGHYGGQLLSMVVARDIDIVRHIVDDVDGGSANSPPSSG
jgi:hypothetical protein